MPPCAREKREQPVVEVRAGRSLLRPCEPKRTLLAIVGLTPFRSSAVT